MKLSVQHKEIGIMGTGSNMFRCGCAHSSGQIFVGTYGPSPAIVWQYDPQDGTLKKIGEPGEYQLDCMVEAPNGKIYIGTAYKGLVYELDPASGQIRDLGSPPGDSTPWIFTMIRTRSGEIYGAKGVALFHLDWRTGKMESCGLVPGDHGTGEHTSAPIVRSLEERPDGLIWGDTNRWIFTFAPASRQITPIADLTQTDDACYAIIHSNGELPVNDLYFQVYSRFSGKIPSQSFFVCRADTGTIEPFPLKGLIGFYWLTGWWMDGETPRLLISNLPDGSSTSQIAVVDIEKCEIIDKWIVEGRDIPPFLLAGPGLWFYSGARGTLLQATPGQKKLTALATNPVPVECRCLAINSDGQLGTDSYDCGFVFTRPADSQEFSDHGRVWLDDHRCNYGPAKFGGVDERYFLANHSEAWSSLWVTDLQSNRHWRIGESAAQIVRTADGTIWGTEGPTPPCTKFNFDESWIAARQATPGRLFKWVEGAESVQTFPEVGPVGPFLELPALAGHLLFCAQDKMKVLNTIGMHTVQEQTLPANALALTAGANEKSFFCLLEGYQLCIIELNTEGQLGSAHELIPFGNSERGFFVLPQSGHVVGLAHDGTVSTYDPTTGQVWQAQGPVPLPAGPAIHPTEDKWYFSHQSVIEYSLSSVA